MNEIALANRAADWRRLKALVLDRVSSPITKRVSNLGLDEFFAWYGQEARPGFTKATVSAWRVALEAFRDSLEVVADCAHVHALDKGRFRFEHRPGLTHEFIQASTRFLHTQGRAAEHGPYRRWRQVAGAARQ
jgi:hypothetical protein